MTFKVVDIMLMDKFLSSENTLINIIVIGSVIVVGIILLNTLSLYLKYNKKNINSNVFYNKIIINLSLAIIVVVLPLVLNNNLSNQPVESLSQDSQNEKENITFNPEPIKQKINLLKNSLSLDEYNNIKNEIENITDLMIKNDLLSELGSLKVYVDLNETIENLKTSYDIEKYYNTYKEIEKINDNDIKSKLNTNIMSLNKGVPLNINSGTRSGKVNNITYYEVVPRHPLTNMPLIVVMQPYDCHASLAENSSRYTKEEFFFLTSDVGPYNDNMLKDFKKIIDSTVSKYNINRNKIIITGHSNGGLSTLKMVSFFPNYFAAAVPISSTSPEFRASSYAKTAFWGICAQQESCATTMKEYASRIGGNAHYSVVSGGHGDSGCAFLDKNVLSWALAQEIK